jgi:hypothetical protein
MAGRVNPKRVVKGKREGGQFAEETGGATNIPTVAPKVLPVKKATPETTEDLAKVFYGVKSKSAITPRSNYIAALKSYLEEQDNPGALVVAVSDYAATTGGEKAISLEITNLLLKDDYDTAILLHTAMQAGKLLSGENKALLATAKLAENRERALRLAVNAPDSDEALKKYVDLLVKDGLEAKDEALTTGIFDDLLNSKDAIRAEKDYLRTPRFLVELNGSIVGTPKDIDPFLVEHYEKLAENNRFTNRLVSFGGTLPGYIHTFPDNGALGKNTEVSYDKEKRVINFFSSETPGDRYNSTKTYSYRDVPESVYIALAAAREPMRFYALVFSPIENGGSLGNKEVQEYSFAKAYANGLYPLTESRGPVPSKLFGKK